MAETTLRHEDGKNREFTPTAFIERQTPVEGFESPANNAIDVAIVKSKPSSRGPEDRGDIWIFVVQIGRSCECACSECENCESDQCPANGLAIPLSSIDPLIKALHAARRQAEGRVIDGEVLP